MNTNKDSILWWSGFVLLQVGFNIPKQKPTGLYDFIYVFQDGNVNICGEKQTAIVKELFFY